MMIATGGLLRINARRKEDKKRPPKHHRKHKKKRRSEVVVVKGKLELCSLSGVVALLGIMVLLVGGAMASLGYWPKHAVFTSINTTITTVTTNTTTTTSSTTTSTNPEGETGDIFNFNTTDNFNKTERGFLEKFLDRYLCNQRLKVVGPLVMGAGLFLFICANAVLHESRDRQTKVINLRDIYSTTIDLHQHRRAAASPANGLVNLVNQKDEEDAGKLTGAEPGVFSIYSPLNSSTCPPNCPYPPSPLPLHFIDPYMYRDPIDPNTDPKCDPKCDPKHDPIDLILDPKHDSIDPNPDPKHDPIDPNPDPKHVPIDPNPDPKHDPIDSSPDPKHDPIDPSLNSKHDLMDPNPDPIDPNPDPKHDPIYPKHDSVDPNPDPKHDPIYPKHDSVDPDPKHDLIDPNNDPKHDPIDPNPDPKHDPIYPKHDSVDPNHDPKHDSVDPNHDPNLNPDPKHDPNLNPDPSLPSQTALGAPVHCGR